MKCERSLKSEIIMEANTTENDYIIPVQHQHSSLRTGNFGLDQYIDLVFRATEIAQSHLLQFPQDREKKRSNSPFVAGLMLSSLCR